jgi:hypothetical protein
MEKSAKQIVLGNSDAGSVAISGKIFELIKKSVPLHHVIYRWYPSHISSDGV